MHKKWISVFVKAAVVIMILSAWLAGLRSVLRQEMYRGGYYIAVTNGNFCMVNDLSQKVVQEFEAPQDNPQASVSVRIGTFSGESRSGWKAQLYECGTEKLVCEGLFEAEDIEDNQYYNVIDQCAQLRGQQSYRLEISPVSFQNNKGLAFYVNDTGKKGYLAGGKDKSRFDLEMRISGDFNEKNGFWAGSYIAVSLFVLLIFIRIGILQKKQIPWVHDRVVQTMVLMLVYYFLQQGAMDAYIFTDENDNIRGGMIIAEGGVIYRDYITQHMPFAYYLCAVFALLGAGSVPQFRLVYYMVCAGAAGFIYMRNGEKFGKCRIGIFLIIQPFVLYMIHGDFAFRILSDNIQALAMVILLLEYLDYRKTFEIGIKRSLIVAISIYVGFGCAFLCAYPIAVVVVGVLISEVTHFRKSGQPFSFYIQRYKALVLFTLIPFVLSVVYFYINGALRQAYEMAYRFNTEVYPLYSGITSNKLEPLINGVQNFLSTIIDNMTMLSEQFTGNSFVQLLLLLSVAVCVGKEIWKRNYLTSVSAFLFLCLCFTRKQEMSNFHAVIFWSVALLIVVSDQGIVNKWKIAERQPLAIAAVLGVLACQPYASAWKDNFFSDHVVEINRWEQFVVENTKEEETILIDSFYYDSIYLLYKNRYSANRLPYFLPWYMDWYQEDTVRDLQDNKPAVVLFNPQAEVWGFTDFMEELEEQINKDYIPDRKTGVYVRKM